MELGSATKKIGLLVLTVAAIFSTTAAILHHGEGHVVAAAQGVARQNQAKSAIQPDRPQGQPSKSMSDDEAAFASLADAEVSRFREGVTLAQWMTPRRKNEAWEKSTDEGYFDCRAFVRTEALPSGRQVTRTVYFYPPSAPTPAIFPTLRGQALVNYGCTLAMVRVQMRAPNEQTGHAFAQALQQRLAKQYGESIGMKGTGFSGSGDWEDAARWMATSEIVSAYNPTETGDSADSDSVFVFARLPVVYEIEQNACCRLKAYRYRSIENEQFHRAVEIADVNAVLSKRIGNLYAALFSATASLERSQKPENMKSRDAVVPLLHDWLNTVKTLPPGRRAAGLYAADRLFIAAIDIGDFIGWEALRDVDKPNLRLELQGMGATFEFDELGKCYNYSSNWLDEARKLNPDGAVGQMAVLVSLARGGAPQLGKDKHHDIFHEVIADGEWLLAKNPDPRTAAQVHFIIGDAYSDIVALAGGAEPDYGETFRQDEADSARKKALAHYRAGLAVDGVSENAKDAWLQAWHLSAGLLPTTRYVYIND